MRACLTRHQFRQELRAVRAKQAAENLAVVVAELKVRHVRVHVCLRLVDPPLGQH